MPITGKGWELHVERLGVQSHGKYKRTLGSYQVYRDGKALPDLNGHICEPLGPGNNKVENNGKRIEEGRYPLWTQFGKYRSIGYSPDINNPGQAPMPGIRLESTGKRTAILIHPGHPPGLYLSSVGCLNPSQRLASGDMMNYWDSRNRVIAMIESLKAHAPQAFRHETMTRIDNAWIVIDGEPSKALAVPRPSSVLESTMEEPVVLPISKSAAKECAQWLLDNFAAKLEAAVRKKPYKMKHLCGIVCQETAYKWLKWKATMTPKEIVERCVFDASGDYPGTSRGAFPKNTAAFRAKYGDAFTNMLIEEANKTRRLQNWSDEQWVYKGYGIFQYDLQHIDKDRAFFEQKQWYSFDTCLQRCVDELDAKYKAKKDLWKAIEAYNGSGARAKAYVENVKVFTDYCAEITRER